MKTKTGKINVFAAVFSLRFKQPKTPTFSTEIYGNYLQMSRRYVTKFGWPSDHL